MDIRFARPDDVGEVAELWCDAFPGRRTVADRAGMLEDGGRYGGLETVLVGRDDRGRLLGACKIYRLRQILCGVPLPMMGLAAVAVAPFARRQGVGAALCAAALRAARERGDVVSALYPFRPDYYRALGWGLVGELHEYRVRTAALRPEAVGDPARVRPIRLPDDLGPIARCYARAVADANGPIERDERIWAYRLTGEDLGVRPVEEVGPGSERRNPLLRAVVHEDTEVRGYALLRHRPAGRSGEGALEIRELVAETEAAYRALLGHIARQADQWPRVIYPARPDEGFDARLSDPRAADHHGGGSLYVPTARILAGPMLRLLDVPAALTARPWFMAGGAAAASIRLGIEVDDRQLPENGGGWTVRIEGGHGTVSRAVEVGAPDVAIRTDAATLARLYAGELAPSMAGRIGDADVSGDVGAADDAFATRRRFWLPDEF